MVGFLENRARPAEVLTSSAGAFSPYRKADPAVCGGHRRKAAPVVAFELGIDGAATFTGGPAVKSHLPASPRYTGLRLITRIQPGDLPHLKLLRRHRLRLP